MKGGKYGPVLSVIAFVCQLSGNPCTRTKGMHVQSCRPRVTCNSGREGVRAGGRGGGREGGIPRVGLERGRRRALSCPLPRLQPPPSAPSHAHSNSTLACPFFSSRGARPLACLSFPGSRHQCNTMLPCVDHCSAVSSACKRMRLVGSHKPVSMAATRRA